MSSLCSVSGSLSIGIQQADCCAFDRKIEDNLDDLTCAVNLLGAGTVKTCIDLLLMLQGVLPKASHM